MPPNKEFDPRYTKKTLKFIDGSIMGMCANVSNHLVLVLFITDIMTAGALRWG